MSATGSRRWLATAGRGPRSPARAGTRGFTLIEMMVAIAIMALVAGIGFPALHRMLARDALVSARGTISLALAQARSAALAHDAAVRVGIADAGGGRTAVVATGLAPAPLPAGITVDWPRDGVVVYGDGTALGGTGAVRAAPFAAPFTISPATARISFAP